MVLLHANVNAQITPDSSKIGKIYEIRTTEKKQVTGKIVSIDLKEVIVEIENVGNVSIPKMYILEMKEVIPLLTTSFSHDSERKTAEVFATRYLVTTNGLPIEKGSSYIQWNWFGPDIQFSPARNFSCGIITSWLGSPFIGDVKYCFNIAKNTNMSVGMLAGYSFWILPDFNLLLPFASFTYGTRRDNITISGGYGKIRFDDYSDVRALCSVAGMVHVSNKASIVFDSFIMPGIMGTDKEYRGFYMPGMRFQTSTGSAFQFGFVGWSHKAGETGAAIPMVQWFKML